MPVFQATLINTSSGVLDVTPDSTNTTATIVDNSNYLLSDQNGFLSTDFTLFRKILVTDPNLALYIFSSFAGGDQLIAAGVSGSNSFIYPMTIDGVYNFQLITLPTWRSSATYAAGVNIYDTASALVYVSLLGSNINHLPASSPTYWSVVDEAAVGVACNFNARLARDYDLRVAKIQATLDAVTQIAGTGRYNLYKNPAYLKADELDNLISAIEFQGSAQQWDDVAWMIGIGKTIAAC